MSRSNGIAHRLYTGDISYDFVGRRKLWYLVSGVLLLIAALALVLRPLNLGIEFRGGSDFQAPITVTETTVDDVRTAVEQLNLPNNDELTVTTVGSGTVRVQTRALQVPEVTQVKQAIAEVAGIQPDEVAYQLIGASWGQQITTQALIALAVFLVLVSLLIWGYFRDFKMSISAIVALLHDLVITIGVYALAGFAVTPATMIGVLTILGYSLYDTVVVFDKIRENVTDLEHGRKTYSEASNMAVNQVLVRSLNTTIIGVLPVAALLFTGAFVLGTGPLKDLGLALFVGMIAGAYSSLFIATPLLAQMREAEPAMKEHRQRLERRAARGAAKSGARHGSSAAPLADDEVTTVRTVALAESAEVVDASQLGVYSADQLRDQLTRTQHQRQSRSQRKK